MRIKLVIPNPWLLNSREGTVWGLEAEYQLYIKTHLFSAQPTKPVAPAEHPSVKMSVLSLPGKPTPGKQKQVHKRLAGPTAEEQKWLPVNLFLSKVKVPLAMLEHLQGRVLECLKWCLWGFLSDGSWREPRLKHDLCPSHQFSSGLAVSLRPTHCMSGRLQITRTLWIREGSEF